MEPRYEVEFEDVEYARAAGQSLMARVYRPRGAGDDLPALVDVHGGAWCYFDRLGDAYFDSALAAQGMVVAALDFRQAEHGYPSSVCDVRAGVRWLRGFLRTRVDRGCTVLVSSHLLAELALSADSVVIVKNGRLVTQGPVADLVSGVTAVRVRTPDAERLWHAPRGLTAKPKAIVFKLRGSYPGISRPLTCIAQ